MDFSKLKIAIDGPASSGKSTVAKILADELKLLYIDTGAMYRAITFLTLKNNIDVNDEKSILQLLANSDILFKRSEDEQLVLINNEDVTKEIRQNDVTNNVSKISSHALIREELVKRQQNMASNHGVVMDGRDIGTVVLPNAEFKFFLVADVDERANRRYIENQEKGIDTDFEQLKKEIIARDEYDTNRKNSPLIQAEDAILINTTSLSILEVVEKCKKTITEN